MVVGDGKPGSSLGLVNRMFPHLTPGGNIKAVYPPAPNSPSSSGRSTDELDNAAGSRSPSVNLSTDKEAFAYRLHESDSASSLGSLADKVAEFVEPERVREEIPHKATGAIHKRQRKKTREWHLFPGREICFSCSVGLVNDHVPRVRPTPPPSLPLFVQYAYVSPFESTPRPLQEKSTAAALPQPPPHALRDLFFPKKVNQCTQKQQLVLLDLCVDLPARAPGWRGGQGLETQLLFILTPCTAYIPPLTSPHVIP
jgi:hypothetical protein